ncbi:uncharacterized protein VTP21DRAFT_4780 [Calcarisporiella thermophila]|uniref:uncharacterized protein n=1 Tax=Calcarisporiella thermophila TaxID=911321 RepID=UPI0037422967
MRPGNYMVWDNGAYISSMVRSIGQKKKNIIGESNIVQFLGSIQSAIFANIILPFSIFYSMRKMVNGVPQIQDLQVVLEWPLEE